MRLPSVFLITYVTILHIQTQTIHSCNHNTTCGCSNNVHFFSRIVGGQDAKAETWNWVVTLRIRNIFRCAGSILSSSWIITAAHCFLIVDHVGTTIFRVDASDITVHAGSINQYEENQVRRVVRIVLHPKFDEFAFMNDIALLQLSSSFDMSNVTLAKICLPYESQNEFPPVNSFLVAVGWGRLSENGPQSLILQQVILKTIDYQNSTCFPLIRDYSKQFCAGVENSRKDTCQGDSGGPLMMFTSSEQWVLTGITSFGYGCAQPGYAGVYTRIITYLDWINTMINNTDNSLYPDSLVPNTPYEDDDLEWEVNISFHHSMSFIFSLILLILLLLISIYSFN